MVQEIEMEILQQEIGQQVVSKHQPQLDCHLLWNDNFSSFGEHVPHQQQPPHNCHVGWPAITGGVACLEERIVHDWPPPSTLQGSKYFQQHAQYSPLHDDMPHNYHREDSITIRHEESEDFSDDEGSDLPMYGGQHDTISDALCIGDTFATNANEDGADFYLLRCSEEKYKTARALSDSRGNILSTGSYLVEGYYYELVEGAKHIYYMPASQPKVLLTSHLVRSIKIPLEPLEGEPHKFKLAAKLLITTYTELDVAQVSMDKFESMMDAISAKSWSHFKDCLKKKLEFDREDAMDDELSWLP
ncbi:hypothetical protein L7F22_001139 [Adiantum nelumboides]|nr:hypothetical protein [Adiantum nelumboides]